MEQVNEDKYIDVYSNKEDRRSTIVMEGVDVLKIMGNLPHGYEFIFRSKKDAEKMRDFSQAWIDKYYV